jgi:hypothetical protein
VFGQFEYAGLSSGDIDKVAKLYDKRFKIVTRVLQDDGIYRGIYDMGGSLYYYRYRPGTEYTIYPLIVERYTSERTLMDNTKLLNY